VIRKDKEEKISQMRILENCSDLSKLLDGDYDCLFFGMVHSREDGCSFYRESQSCFWSLLVLETTLFQDVLRN
jgi:hypothetical protein